MKTQLYNRCLKSAKVCEFTDRFDDGLDILIGEREVKLSDKNLELKKPITIQLSHVLLYIY